MLYYRFFYKLSTKIGEFSYCENNALRHCEYLSNAKTTGNVTQLIRKRKILSNYTCQKSMKYIIDFF